MTIRLVVDSSSDLGLERAKAYGIAFVPLTIAFGEEHYRDYYDLDPPTFYARMAHSAELPRTSTPSTGDFEEAYRRLIQEGATEIISAHLSSAFSGTYNSARIAAQTVQEESKVPIHVLDSRWVSAAVGLPILRAAQQIEQGATAEQVIAYLEDVWQRGKVFILLDTLANLERTGRIGRAQAVVGSFLNIKPIITILDGVVTPLDRVRTREKARARIRALLMEYTIADAAIATSDAAMDEEFTALVQTAYQGPIEAFSFGPVVGTNAGPRSGGIFIIPQK